MIKLKNSCVFYLDFIKINSTFALIIKTITVLIYSKNGNDEFTAKMGIFKKNKSKFKNT